ncbi:MAG: FtsX-like permease family protein [Candidatus Thorarchaeota archaeon]
MKISPMAWLGDQLVVVYELVLCNKRLFFPTMVGLVIALAIVSHSNVLIDSYSSEILEKMLDIDRLEGDIRIEERAGYPGSSLSFANKLTNYSAFNTHVEKAIDLVKYGNYISERRWYTRLALEIMSNNSGQELSRYSEMLASSEAVFYAQIASILNTTENGRLPSSSDEVVLIRPLMGDPYQEELWQNYAISDEVMISIGYELYEAGGFNKTVTIVGILEYDNSGQPFGTTTTLLTRYFDYMWGDYRFLSTRQFLNETITEYVVNTEVYDYQCTIVGEIDLDYSVFNSYDVTGEISKLRRFLQELDRTFLEEPLFDTHIHSQLLGNLLYLQSSIMILIVILLLVSLPVIAIALYLVIYSFGLVRRQYQAQIGIIKTRGSSSFQIFFILLTEIIVSTVVATGFGFLASLGLAEVILRSSDFLLFEGDPVPVKVSISMVQNLVLWGIFFAILLNFTRIVKMSRQNIIETQVPTEKRDPLWKRRYLDVAMFLIGTGTWVLMMSVMEASTSGREIAPLFLAIAPFLALLMIPAPFFIFFGTIMVIARFFPYLMQKLSEIIWRVGGGINAFSIRNIVRHKQAANRAVLLVTLALSFSILSSSLIFSMDETERLRYYYAEGADITITDPIASDRSLSTILQQNVSHLTSTSTTFQARCVSYGYASRVYQFLFVDPDTYASTAFMHSSYRLSSPLSSLMNELADNQTVLVYEENLYANSMSIGNNISIRFTNASLTERLSFKIGGTFRYWPTFYPQPWYFPTDYFWIIGNLGLFESLNESNYLSQISAKYLGRIDSDQNLEFTVQQISNLTNKEPIAPALRFKEYKADFGRIFSLSVLNADLIVCMAVATVGIVMFAFFTYVERGKEIGVERALGMTQGQTAQSFLVEAIMILIFGTIIGTISGMYFVSMFLQVTHLGETIPPSAVAYPIPVLSVIILGILIAAGIGTVIPAYLSTRKDISRTLKVE